jgi:hypothetical protein
MQQKKGKRGRCLCSFVCLLTNIGMVNNPKKKDIENACAKSGTVLFAIESGTFCKSFGVCSLEMKFIRRINVNANYRGYVKHPVNDCSW